MGRLAQDSPPGGTRRGDATSQRAAVSSVLAEPSRLRRRLGGKTPDVTFRDPPTTPEPSDEPAAAPPVETESAAATQTPTAERNMLPARGRRRLGAERVLVRIVATCGIVGIGVALGAILVSSKVQGWITGLVVALVSVVLSAILWSSRQV